MLLVSINNCVAKVLLWVVWFVFFFQVRMMGKVVVFFQE